MHNNASQQLLTTAIGNSSAVAQQDELAETPFYTQPATLTLVTMHLSVFVVGLIGNFLVCISVYRNTALQTVTNYFIVNLAVADFLVILICLPPTLVWDLTLTWYFGLALCKLVLYLQNVSVSVSVITLTCISVDRWYAICRPLHFKSTKGAAKITIVCIWLVSLIISSPDLVFLATKSQSDDEPNMYVDCTYNWPEANTQIYQLCIVALLFVVPFVLMIISYSHIVVVLWRSKSLNEAMLAESADAFDLATLSSGATSAENTQHRSSTNHSSSRPQNACSQQARFCRLINSRKKAAKMLITIVVMFGLCYLPVHFLNTLRNTYGLPQNDVTTIASLISHWLCYFNSALNPIIYNVMNSKFRAEFANFIFCRCCYSSVKSRPNGASDTGTASMQV